MRTFIGVCILVLAGLDNLAMRTRLVTQAAAQSAFTRRDVAVGDPKVSYGSTEFSPDWKYLVWTETFADRTINQVAWHCEVNPDTGDLIPADGKGFRAFDTTSWGRPTPGRDSQGVFYVGMNRQGQWVLVRPTSATTGTVTILPTPADLKRRSPFSTDLPQQPGAVGYVFWITNSNVVSGGNDPRNTWVELRYLSLANPSVEVVLQHQNRPPAPSTGFAPLDIAYPRSIRGSAKITSGIRDTNGFVQVVEFDLSQATPTPRLVTNDPATKADAFPWTFGNQDILMSGTTGGTGATQIQTRPVGTQFFTPVETVTPMTETLTPPVFSQSNERIPFGGLPYTCLQINSSTGEFFGTTFQETGEIWLSTILQTPQRQWRLSDDSDRAKFENEPFVGRTKVWVFYSSVPKGTATLSTVIQLRRCDTPLSAATAANVSAASYISTSLAAESIVSAFGSGLATATLAAISTPLPTTLAGTTVNVRDSAGTERLAPLFFVSPTQINYQMPAGTANGAAIITITSGDGSVSTGVSQITSVAPGLFTANASGQGLAAALALRTKADSLQQFEPVARFDAAQNKFVAVPIDLGPETDQVFLILFSTGLRFRSSLSGVSASIGGVDSQVTFAGAQGGFVGLDQVNLRLERSLIGRGEVDVVLVADGRAANTVKLAIK